MGYVAPNAPVSASWANHKNRNPPSSEPGTDYALAYGAVVTAVEAGTVIEIKTSNSGGMGRYAAVALNDGRTFRHIHMSRVDVKNGQKVSRGQSLGLSGASGYGSDWYYGPHVHTTLWPGAYWAAPTIDFQLYVGPPPTPTPTPPPIIEGIGDMRLVRNTNDEGGTVRFYTENGYTKVSNPTDRNLLWRFITESAGADPEKIPVYNNMQLDIIAKYIRRADPLQNESA